MRQLWVVLAGLTAPLPIVGQVSSPTPIAVPVVSLTGGVGNSMGWFGFQAERYFAQGRVSAFGGLGYTPSIDTFDPSGVTFAAGLRGYTAGLKHRGFAEASGCQVAIRSDPIDPSRYYGPCLQLGYQFASRGGFTMVASGGVGFILSVREGDHAAQGLVGLGFGYTWRRRT